MLNPWHTYFRASQGHVKEDINKSESWQNKIEGRPETQGQPQIDGWRDFCEIKSTTGEGSKYIPNSILPFYSVDMMLNYLKESFDASKIIADNAFEGCTNLDQSQNHNPPINNNICTTGNTKCSDDTWITN